ncbi:hypothetical protein QE152_g15850 [Popillia japonica]|uniref:Uncharacterized protein n=1 Tax=Popillia japonica TaxID=7064 RepID=A0AAW1L6V7_POPJA
MLKNERKTFTQKDNRILKKKTKARGKQTNWLSSSEESDDSKIADKAQTSDSDICLSETDHEEEQLAYLKPTLNHLSTRGLRVGKVPNKENY